MPSITKPPEGYEFVTDINERVQAKDLIWSDDDADWIDVGRFEIGIYAMNFSKIVRPVHTKPTPTVKVIKRTRRAKP